MSDELDELIAVRAALRARIVALHEEVTRINMRITDARFRAANRPDRTSGFPRGTVKRVLVQTLLESGATGVNARSVVEAAARQGLHLERTTISSLLSRMKRDGVVEHDGNRYRLPMPVKQNAAGAWTPAADNLLGPLPMSR